MITERSSPHALGGSCITITASLFAVFTGRDVSFIIFTDRQAAERFGGSHFNDLLLHARNIQQRRWEALANIYCVTILLMMMRLWILLVWWLFRYCILFYSSGSQNLAERLTCGRSLLVFASLYYFAAAIFAIDVDA